MREPAKWIARGCALVAVAPLYISYIAQALLLGRDRSLESHSQLISLWPGLSGRYLRNAFYRLTLAACDTTAVFEFGVLLSKTQARIGPRVYIGPRCHLGWVNLNEGVMLGPAVQITSGAQTHGTKPDGTMFRDQPGVLTAVTIGQGAWIGASAIVMNDVGVGTIVGAGAVVTRALPPRVTAVGIPAKTIKSLEVEAAINESNRKIAEVSRN